MKKNQWLYYLLTHCKVGYFSQTMKQIIVSKTGEISLIEASSTFTPFITILHRQHYDEQLTTYPIDNKKEIKNLVALEHKDKGNTFLHQYNISAQLDGTSYVNHWFIPCLSELSSLIIIPETRLLDRTLQINELLTIQEGGHTHEPLFVAKSLSGLISSLANGLIKNIDTFCLAAGFAVPGVEKIHTLSQSAFLFRLLKGLSRLSPEQWLSCKQPLDQEKLKRAIIPTGLAVSVTLTVYLTMSSAYLVWKKDHLEQQYQSYKQQVNSALTVQNSLLKTQKQLTRQQLFKAERQSFSQVWPTLVPIFQQASLTLISYKDKKYQISGSTEKASDLLQTLMEQPQVVNAQFIGQTRRQRNQDRFSITFEIASTHDE